MDDSGAGQNETGSDKARTQPCPGCGDDFDCGMLAGIQPCWCACLPLRRPVPDKAATCYCPRCLEKLG